MSELDLESIQADIWQRLMRGKADRRSPFHAPVVASIGPDGRPEQRVMVLRHFDASARVLRFHTDARSTKIGQLSSNAASSVLLYDPAAKIQLRLSGQANIYTETEADQPWQSSTPFARRCYMAETAPGSISDGPTSGLPSWIEGQQPIEEQLTDFRPNFGILVVCFDRIDWLYLANEGHRRAQFVWNDGKWSSHWVVP